MKGDSENTDTILRINRMAKEVATGIPTKTGDERDPEASIYDDGRINVRYSPKNGFITIVANGHQGRMLVYLVGGPRPEKPQLFIQGSWERALESLHRNLPKTQEER